MRQFRTSYYQTKAGPRLSVVQGGDRSAPALLFLHGAGGGAVNFMPQLESFSNEYRVVVPEMRGHGDSQWIRPKNIEDLHTDLAELIEFCELPREFSIIAHCFGGCLAIRFASRHPSRVRSLALLNSGASMPRGLAFHGSRLFSFQADRLRAWFPWMLQANNEVCADMVERMVREWDSWSEVARLSMPCLVVAGTRDRLIPLWVAKRTAEMIPRCRLQILAGSGHVCMRHASRRIEEVLRDWLAEVYSADALGPEWHLRHAAAETSAAR